MQINIEYKDKLFSYLGRMNDVRFVGQVVFVIVVLMISWSGVKSIQTNYGLQKQITALKQQNELQKLQNDNLVLKNEYLKSNQYLELSARQNFGLASPGEKEVVVPPTVALAYTIDIPITASEAKSNKPKYHQNFESWTNFFLHRQSNN